MKMMILKILVVLIAIIAAAAVIALFTKKNYRLSREIVINRSKQDVYSFIRLNRNQKIYSKWLSLDPETKIELRGAADGTPGAILAFESQDKKAGKGEWETTKLVEGESIDFELRFLEPFAFVANGQFLTEAISPHQTKITWVYNGGMNWPMNFLLIFLDMDKLVGKDIQTSLETLKTYMER